MTEARAFDGHVLKAEHNLRFVATISKEQFYDWAVIGCYYACYHAALELIQTKRHTSKNHLATLCIIIKEFYKKKLSKEDIEILSNVIDYEDVLFYVETKNKRESATYSTKTAFDKNDVEKLRIQILCLSTKPKTFLPGIEVFHSGLWSSAHVCFTTFLVLGRKS